MSLTGMLLVGVVAIVASQAFAITPPITDSRGRGQPGSIATLEQVTLIGSRQWDSVPGRDASKPVLLFLAGGRAEALATASRAGRTRGTLRRRQLGAPGLGQVLDAVDRATITPERYIEAAQPGAATERAIWPG